MYTCTRDNLRIANNLCEAGSIFYVHAGTHQQQYVTTSKDGNFWLGVGHSTGGLPVLDGEGMTSSAFNGGMKNNKIAYLEIEDYTGNGIYSTSSSSTGIEIYNMSFYDIAPNKDGESNGAVNLYYCQDVQVRDSYFEDVASAILLTHCDGPLKAIDNEALNPGRNFFQCNDCEGAGIRVNGNSLEHTTGYGNTVLEDWINLYKSEGTSGDYIQVNNNRARVVLSNGQAMKVSNSGCMVILGDDGGKYQEAKNNIGVNPGNCGIGVADGQYMRVKDNKMYSQRVPGISNVGFYAMDIYDDNNISCRKIDFYSGSNEANWTCGNPTHCESGPKPNWAHGDGECKDLSNNEMTRTYMRSTVNEVSFGTEIWNDW